jgi:hypothetical protein
MKFWIIEIILLNFVLITFGQYAPAAGSIGSTAIYKDSSCIISWANEANTVLGWQNILDSSIGKANYGSINDVLGKADNSTLSLGDGGSVIISFCNPITNGPNWDFVVFENAFNDSFLELAFIEASSDGVNFYRFPAHSLTPTDTQVSAFGTISPEKINNLAGKYRAGFGTPFDLSQLLPNPNLDIQNITHLKVVDVIGSINPLYASQDSAGNFINDPFPTPFASSGFDLDAVGVINQNTAIENITKNSFVKTFPNPFLNHLYVDAKFDCQLTIYTIEGNKLWSNFINKGISNLSKIDLIPGFYIFVFVINGEIFVKKMIKN